MARDTFPRYSAVRRALIVLAAAVAALGAGAATASADVSLGGPLPYVLGPVTGFDPNALTGAGVGPMSGPTGQAAPFGQTPAGRQVTTEQGVVQG